MKQIDRDPIDSFSKKFLQLPENRNFMLFLCTLLKAFVNSKKEGQKDFLPTLNELCTFLIRYFAFTVEMPFLEPNWFLLNMFLQSSF